MKNFAIILVTLISITVSATEQIPDRLIYKTDTIGIYTYPLESLIKTDPLINKRVLHYSNTICGSSDCWREYVGTWKIINDSLFLTKLTDGCENHIFNLKKVFSKRKTQNRKVFANWYTGEIKDMFNYKLVSDGKTEEYKPTKSFSAKIINGKIISISVETISIDN
jgi:hypothetical protein